MKRNIVLFLIFSGIGVMAFGEEHRQATSRQSSAYSGSSLAAIAFPIGGIATGNITLGGRGDIHELEIFNRPAKNIAPEMTFFSLCVRDENGKTVAKILEREILPPYTGWMGFPRNQLAGVSRFSEVEFIGEYPFAHVRFIDASVPASVALEAFNPLIPLDPERSGLPAAIFNWTVHNPTDAPVRVSIAFSMQNPIRTQDENHTLTFGSNINEFREADGIRGIRMTSRALRETPEYGSIVFATSEEAVDIETRWYRGGWWDNAHLFWDDFSDDGRIQDVRETQESESGRTDVATVSVFFTLEPGQTKHVPFYLAWYFPNRINDWNGEAEMKGKKFKNEYANRFDDAWDVAALIARDIASLSGDTRLFHGILFSSTYPDFVLDAVSSQISSLKTNLLIRDEKGQTFGWEGLTDNAGCCMGTCTHVWNYENTLAFLFPSLERNMRETAFLNDTFENGYQTFRTLFPRGPYWWRVHPAADGQMGNIMRTYREWKLSGDSEWLKKMWPRVEAALEFAWKGTGNDPEVPDWQKNGAPMSWDPDGDGVMEGQQHNTYDIDFYGPNTMVGSLYLGALKASAVMAASLGKNGKAGEYMKKYSAGSKEYDRLLWNGEYYRQQVQVLDGLTLPDYLQSPVKTTVTECACKQSPGGTQKALERGEIIPKYQYGNGCLSDQLLGQYLAFVNGLGYLMDPDHIRQALASIYRCNFKKPLGAFSNVQRVYALNNEGGLLLCSWPNGDRPALPFVYSDEVWTGIEYQVAASLIYAGLVQEGLSIVETVRERHKGFNRNPWDEFECGHHYARAMASWAVLLALSGVQYDGISHSLSFAPALSGDLFRTFWSCGTGWGSFTMEANQVRLRVEKGVLRLGRLRLPKSEARKQCKRILFQSHAIGGRLNKGECDTVSFGRILNFLPGDELTIAF